MMRKKRPVRSIISFLSLSLIILLLFARESRAQLAVPNDAGVSMAGVLLIVPDLDPSLKFWTMLGGIPFKIGQGTGMKFPGGMIFLRKGEPTGGSVGSVVNHFGFHVPSVSELLVKLNAAGVKTEKGQNAQQVFVYSPDGLTKIEMLEDSSLSVPIAFHHMHFYIAANSNGGDPVPDIQAWYGKVFGAKPGKRGQFQTANIPGIELTFTKSDSPVSGTKGRSLNQIGFEVKNLDAFCKAAEANGIKFDSPYTKRPEIGLSLAFLTDPWGTYIELTDGLDHY
jgi:catechol 2,3-dioxygenase-like lactoylglutathione lyase family enzyme